MTLKEIEELAGHRTVSPWIVKLVGDAVAKERERVEDLCMRGTQLAVLVAKAEEREACAKIADEYAKGLERNYSEIIADAIRARGNTQ